MPSGYAVLTEFHHPSKLAIMMKPYSLCVIHNESFIMSQNPILNPKQRQIYLEQLRALPDQLAAKVQALSAGQLIARPRPDQWSVAQIIHHLADAHMNAFSRTKRILAEDRPTRKPYSQESWAEMVDEVNADVEASLLILRGLHRRWVLLFESLSEDDWNREGLFRSDGTGMTLDYILAGYANHSAAHLTQLEEALAAVR
jgi:hypothetical protein